MKVVVAMSGGVDSSIAAAILKEEGYEVIGVTFRLWPSINVEDACAVALQIGIPHEVIDLSPSFRDRVIDYFLREYSLGRTPNPCIRCNRYIKFDALQRVAREVGAGLIATGHYARVSRDGSRYFLKKGVDKDQSYFLYLMTQDELAHTIMPLGGMNKDRVRGMARGLGLPERPDSQEICFIPDKDYHRFLMENIPQAARPGPIVDRDGRTLGDHRGIPFYTIGQRRGLGISTKEPLYVSAICHERNTVIVGGKGELYRDELIASGLNWIAIERLEQPMEVKAKIRYLHQEARALITPMDGERVLVSFSQPQMAITPGQAVVFYDGDSVVGGGVMDG